VVFSQVFGSYSGARALSKVLSTERGASPAHSHKSRQIGLLCTAPSSGAREKSVLCRKDGPLVEGTTNHRGLVLRHGGCGLTVAETITALKSELGSGS
jgi:hypothetical protein